MSSTSDLRDLGGGTIGGLLAARAAAAPGNLALIFEDQRFTYRDIDQQATEVAAGLLALGLQPGDAAASFLSNRPECLTSWIGTTRAGMLQVPVNTAYKGAFLQQQLTHCSAKAVVTEAALADALWTVEEWPSAVNTVIFLDGIPDTVPDTGLHLLSWQDLLALGKSPVILPEVGPASSCSIAYTSGTTGHSKGVVSPHLAAVTMAREAAVAFDLTPRDRVYSCLPMFHGAAAVASGLAAIYAGATFVLSPRFSASGFWDEIRATGATQFNALGPLLPILLAQPPTTADREHAVTRVFAAPAPPEVLYPFEERFGVHIIEGYGQTEIKNVMYNPRHGRKVGSLGKPTASSLIEIHDERGTPLPPDTVGEIVYRPKQADIMLTQYLNDPAATLQGMAGLWWHTGDLGYQDHDGFFHFVDRKKDALRRRGENISSADLEAALLTFPGISDAAAIAVRSELGEDEVLAVIDVADPDNFDLHALYRHCDTALPRFMVPRYYRVTTGLPRTPTGKIRKVTLRQDGLTEDTFDAHAAGLTPTRQI
ncbi:AMP-binding protein [Streptomyces sp. NPDC056296]|uniref:AMP-binding protein n=1 Tax=Streptomyces sp. NPDC056296 TaxID=3345775 RepID=UPI0035D5FFC1